MLTDLFKKTQYVSVGGSNTDGQANVTKCTDCGRVLNAENYQKSLCICPACSSYGRLSAYNRIKMTVDPKSFREFDKELEGNDPLKFDGYAEKMKSLQEKTGLKDAVVTGEAKVSGIKCAIGAMDTNFLMASMSTAVGEKITRLFEYATENNLPVVFFAASGGARMHEGILSLMQMAKTSIAVENHSEKGLLYISVITDPTSGGVTASFASLGDVIIGEKGATYAFAGKRVIEATVSEVLADDFQSVENAQKNGFIDIIAERKALKETITKVLEIHSLGR